MAEVVTDDKHYKAIAERIRYHSATYDRIKPEEMADRIDEAAQVAFRHGETAGYQVGKQEEAAARDQADAEYLASINERITSCGVDEAESLSKVPEAIDLVIVGAESDGFAVGKQIGLRDMWESIQCHGKRSNYNTLLQKTSFTKKTFKPIYDIVLVDANGYNWMDVSYPDEDSYIRLINEGQVNMKELEQEQGIKFDFSECTNFTKCFAHALFSELNVIDISKATTLNYAFYGGYISSAYIKTVAPKRIERLICSETTTFVTSTFQYAEGFTYIGFEGVIATTINLSWSPLVPESMKKAILCLKNYAGTENEFANKISFSVACWEALEADSTSPTETTWQEYVEGLGWLV